MNPASTRRQTETEDVQRHLAAHLLERLRPLVAGSGDGRPRQGVQRHGRRLFSYRCFEKERVTRMRASLPMIGVILRGTKEIWIGDGRQCFSPGMVFVVPAKLDLEVVNIPDKRGGRYESLLVEVSEPPRELVAMAPHHAVRAVGSDLGVRLTPELVEAIAHAAHAQCGSAPAEALAGYRLGELLVLLLDAPAARPLFHVSLVDRLSWLVRTAPTRRWTAPEIGRALGLGASTLRRRLARQGTSLRAVLAATRMEIAYRMLTSGEGNVSEAAAAAGYASRSHFMRRFQSLYGASPSAFRSPAPLASRDPRRRGEG